MERHEISYFIGLALLLVITIYGAVTGEHVGNLTFRTLSIILLLGTIAIMYNYSYQNGYIHF